MPRNADRVDITDAILTPVNYRTRQAPPQQVANSNDQLAKQRSVFKDSSSAPSLDQRIGEGSMRIV